MQYSSDLTDEEWEILEPLLLQILPTKKPTRPSKWTKREIFLGILYQLKNGCNWCDLPRDLPPYSTVYWHYKQWRAAGVFEQLMSVLHGQVRQQVKKNEVDNLNHHRLPSGVRCCGATTSLCRGISPSLFHPASNTASCIALLLTGFSLT